MLKESFECLNKEQCAKYLNKLDLEFPTVCGREFLDQLIERHLERIPFENLDLMWKQKEIKTDLDVVYEKIVEHERGGYCFEMNALFLGLLRGLGYEAYPIACRILARPVLGMPTHRASVVVLDGKKYFCDVGFGGIACTRAAFFEDGAVTETAFGKFYFEREYEGWLNQFFTAVDGDEAVKIMMAAEYPSAPVDFAAANSAMCAQGSRFTSAVIVQKMTKDGSLAIDGDRFLVRHGKEKTEQKIASREEAEKIVREVFHIVL